MSPHLQISDTEHERMGLTWAHHDMPCAFSACHNRVFAKLEDWEPESIEMVGREAIPGLTHIEVLPFMHHAKALPT